MQPLTEQQIQARFGILPADIQQAIESNHVEEHIQQIGTKFGLHIDQLGALKDATYLVMLGFVHPNTFATDIAKFAQIPRDIAAQIAESISTELFAPIRTSMQAFLEGRGSTPAVPQSAPAATATAPTLPISPKPAVAPTPATPTITAAPAPAPSTPVSTVPSKAPALALLTPTDHMLAAPTVTPAKTVTLTSAPQTPPPAAPAPTKSGYTVDPYHEPIT